MAEKVKESGTLRFLYNTFIGRIVLRLLISRWVSKLCGAFLSSRLSKPLIKKFVKKNNIDLSQFESDNFKCFNDCFCRKLKPGFRDIPADENVLFAPCDGLLSAYKIEADTVLPVKQSEYTLKSLLCDESLAKKYENGVCLVFRLCVNHYHRYCYPVSGAKGENVFIKGKLHTVRPIALESKPVFAENCREFTVIETEHFGSVLQMEVGAMLVGKIHNLHGAGSVTRGDEKGMFLYGGSTVILLLEKDKAQLDPAFFEATLRGLETPIQMGQTLATATTKSLATV